MINFVNNGTDEAILKSLPIDGASDDLIKAMSKQGLVQKEVQVKGKNGKVFTRKQWVKAGSTTKSSSSDSKTQIPKSIDGWDARTGIIQRIDKYLSQNKNRQRPEGMLSGRDLDSAKKMYGDYVTTPYGQISTEKLFDYAKKHGIYSPSSSQTSQNLTGNSGQKSSKKEDAKKKTQSYTSKIGKTEPERKAFMDKVKSQGIKWTESDNAGINWMRCCMALNNHFASGGNFVDTPKKPKDVLRAEEWDKNFADTHDFRKMDIINTPIGVVQNTHMTQSQAADRLRSLSPGESMYVLEIETNGKDRSDGWDKSVRNDVLMLKVISLDKKGAYHQAAVSLKDTSLSRWYSRERDYKDWSSVEWYLKDNSLHLSQYQKPYKSMGELTAINTTVVEISSDAKKDISRVPGLLKKLKIKSL